MPLAEVAIPLPLLPVHTRCMLNTLSLDGSWDLHWYDGQRGTKPEFVIGKQPDPARRISGEVPGEVHLDLLRAGMIEEPANGLHHLACRWVEESHWLYRRTFTVTPELLQGRTWLHCAGLDLIAVIYLNGQEIGRHGNVFRPCRIEVTGKLCAGENILAIDLESGLFSVADKPAEAFGGNLDNRLHKRYWLRKPQCQFGWDWSPRLLNVGITGSVTLEHTVYPIRVDSVTPLATVSDDLSTGQVRVRVAIEGLAATPTPTSIAVSVCGITATIEVLAKLGLHTYDLTVQVPQPTLWWPIGHGAQPLHLVVTRIMVAGTFSDYQKRIGFRHIAIDQSPHPEGGRHFIIVLNHRRIFCKGGNFVPADLITQRIDRARYETLIDRAVESNCNLLRVWGGGLYESEDFFDLCDERGIIVWQEFIFACSRYPGQDSAFYNEIKAEARYQIRRLAPHASLVVWCGNNENEQGTWDWGFTDTGVIVPDYAIYHHLLPKLLQEEDPSRWYQPSSPISPVAEDGTRAHPTADDQGDQHPWSIGFSDCDFRKYRAMICRFPNEGGILGPNSLSTVMKCLPPGQQKAWSFAWQQHDNSIASWNQASAPDTMLTEWVGRTSHEMTLPEYVHLGGLVQAEGLREYIDNFRRRMFSSASAIFWMYNDTWPTVRSWTIVDHALNRTPSFHAVRRAFAPVSVVVIEDGDVVRIIGVNDSPTAATAELRYGLFQLTGGYDLDQRQAVTLAANAATPLASFPRGAWTSPTSQIAFAVLSRGSEVIARNKLVLPRFAELTWATATPTIRLEAGQAIFRSATFAWGVCLDLDGQQPLADNLFDLYPGQDYALAWPSTTPPTILAIGNLMELMK